MVSVITPTVRKEGLKLVQRALRRQTIEYEWIVGSSFVPEVDCIWIKDEYEGGHWSLNRIYNDLIEKSQSELIVSWQDYTYAEPHALEKFWNCYRETGGVISGVGNKYQDDTWTVKTWQDPRERDDQGTFYKCTPQDIEWNFCAAPRKGLKEIGGFDEQMDFLGFGMDGVSVSERLFDAGYETYLDQTNKSFSLEHGRPKDWDKNNLLGKGYYQRKKELFDKGLWPNIQSQQRGEP